MIQVRLNDLIVYLKLVENGVTTMVTAAAERELSYQDACDIQNQIELHSDVMYFRHLGRGREEFSNKFLYSWTF